MKKLINIFLILSVSVRILSQDVEYLVKCEDKNCGVVIALSGLKLRAGPSVNAKVFTIIPFGSKVVRNHIRPTEEEGYQKPEYAHAIPGWWEKITWQQQEGYVFNAYLGREIPQLTEDFYLVLEDAAGCWSDLYASPQYYYYGLLLNKDSSKAEIHQIKPTFFSIVDVFESVVMHADEREPSLFLFAAKEPFTEDGLIEKHHLWKDWFMPDDDENIISYNNPLRVPESNWNLSFIKTTAKDTVIYEMKYPISLQLENLATGKKQILNDWEKRHFESAKLGWCGDLDRDGLQDFILITKNTRPAIVLLFLSKNSKDGEMMHLGGVYFFVSCY